MNNLKDFSCNCKNCQKIDKIEEKSSDILSFLKGKTNSELENMLINEVKKQKENGTFNREQILQLLESVKGMLPSEKQYNDLKEAIMQL